MRQHLPNLLSVGRIVLVPWLIKAIVAGNTSLALILLLLAGLTDWVDGRLARRWNSTSEIGEHLDVFADFVVIFAAFVAFYQAGFYPYWLPPLIIIMLVLFYITSDGMKLRKDAIGKYYGGFLYLAAIATLLNADTRWYQIISLAIVVYSLAVVYNRIFGCYRRIE